MEFPELEVYRVYWGLYRDNGKEHGHYKKGQRNLLKEPQGLNSSICCRSGTALGFRIQSSGFWAWGVGFGAWDLGFRIWGLGYGV